MAEAELEEAICRAFPVLLPRLHEAGYRIRSRQAILLGRRIDLLLETEEGERHDAELMMRTNVLLLRVLVWAHAHNMLLKLLFSALSIAPALAPRNIWQLH